MKEETKNRAGKYKKNPYTAFVPQNNYDPNVDVPTHPHQNT